jgi:acyl-CoA reductase-like NAD-dependent aldehyde dehydrogenase
MQNYTAFVKAVFIDNALAMSYVHREPLGVALIMGAWNYPVPGPSSPKALSTRHYYF